MKSKSVKPIDFYINFNPTETEKNKQHIHNLQLLKIIQESKREAYSTKWPRQVLENLVHSTIHSELKESLELKEKKGKCNHKRWELVM
jgi:hypothetical protein